MQPDNASVAALSADETTCSCDYEESEQEDNKPEQALFEKMPDNLKRLNHWKLSTKEWQQFIQVQSEISHFKLDPGSHVFITERIYEKLRNKARLRPHT